MSPSNMGLIRETSETSRTIGPNSPVPNYVDSALSTRATLGSEDVEMRDTFDGRRFVVAIDFGTTFSSVSYVILSQNENSEEVSVRRIESIIRYPDEPNLSGQSRRDVPTESSYPEHGQRRTTIIPENEDESDQSSSQPGSESDDENNVPLFDFMESNQNTNTTDEPKGFLWGYSVHDAHRLPSASRNNNGTSIRVSRSKLLLDTTDYTKPLREQLGVLLGKLKKHKFIEEDEDVITDYIEGLFRHTKQQLETYSSFTDETAVELVLCVPIIWKANACRVMHDAMATAMQRTGFAKMATNGKSVNNLFLVNEPEAAAAYVLASDHAQIRPHDTFVLIDAGGGTVDAITYTVDNSEPLRLHREAVEPSGDICGSSFINEIFRDFALQRLQHETYLNDPERNITIESIIDTNIMVEFENRVKRQLSFQKSEGLSKHAFTIHGLKQNRQKGFLAPGEWHVTRHEFAAAFNDSLQGVTVLMKEQLERARRQSIDVNKVVLMGGFADSPALYANLKAVLARINAKQGTRIELIKSANGNSGVAVSCGAVYRALNKQGGPRRTVRSSYGVLRKKPWEPEIFPELLAAERAKKRDKLDGDEYVEDTIDWIIKKGIEYPPRRAFVIPMIHTFDTRWLRRWKCEEILFVSDTSTESHYQKTHPNNADHQIAGKIIVDMTFLKWERRIEKIVPAREERGQPHYKVEFDIVIELDDRNLYFHARWPKGDAGTMIEGSSGQISIAAAFEPGTR